LGVDDFLTEVLRATFPLPVLGVIHARLVEKLVFQLTVRAFERTDEDALLGPALPSHRCRSGRGCRARTYRGDFRVFNSHCWPPFLAVLTLLARLDGL